MSFETLSLTIYKSIFEPEQINYAKKLEQFKETNLEKRGNQDLQTKVLKTD